MAKKNPYVTTIGFNKEDPDHVYVADFLNSMGRGKGQYIVKAIMAYQNPEGISNGHVVVPAVDYEKIKSFVLKIIEERISINADSGMKEIPRIKREVKEEQVDPGQPIDLDEETINDIMQSLNMFR